jgi:hypothetical protein
MLQDDPKNYVPVIASVLEHLISMNAKILQRKKIEPTIFHALRAPSISVEAYLQRIAKYAHCKKDHFILSLIYIDRLIQAHPSIILCDLNAHRLLITSVVLAVKYSSDFFYDNNYYAKIGGVPVEELNNLELRFLFLINFRLYVSTDLFERYDSELQRHSALMMNWAPKPPPVVAPVKSVAVSATPLCQAGQPGSSTSSMAIITSDC